ncbi:methyltransferase domain-containing protein [Sphingomonas alpina]|uniref:Methyltransferase domain-containing protein n=1 Tax=Sphingomonas alpina TaxID=653931 RepID=A0A7H0LK14_9SPHN|nr:methyltransferase domain-containing protein [Sphingomonas alpina]QNQ10017.1 methyltransferase domain-containing protein [Sphingomonas alpina]
MRNRAQDLLTLLPLVEGKPDAMIALARQFRGIDETARALDLATRALTLAPDDGEVRALAADLLSDGVPRWHFVIVRDRPRNDAYEAALRRAIVPGCKVLEIGTGTGLLAMMAARAGAHVVTCEADAAVAAAARDVIAANGLSDRIRVINKHSTTLDLVDLDGPADILVSEIVSNDLLSEGVLPAHEDAVPRLLRPGAAVIPARGRIRIALAEDSGSRSGRVDTASGFDLTPFNRLARPYREVPVASEHLALRSEPADLFDFDFASGGPWPDRRGSVPLGSTGGVVNGIVQWIALEMDDQGRYENRPATGTPSCWGAIFWPFERPVETVAGQIINVAARHETDRIRVWRD